VCLVADEIGPDTHAWETDGWSNFVPDEMGAYGWWVNHSMLSDEVYEEYHEEWPPDDADGTDDTEVITIDVAGARGTEFPADDLRVYDASEFRDNGLWDYVAVTNNGEYGKWEVIEKSPATLPRDLGERGVWFDEGDIATDGYTAEDFLTSYDDEDETDGDDQIPDDAPGIITDHIGGVNGIAVYRDRDGDAWIEYAGEWKLLVNSKAEILTEMLADANGT